MKWLAQSGWGRTGTELRHKILYLRTHPFLFWGGGTVPASDVPGQPSRGATKYLLQVLYSLKTSSYFAACLSFQLYSLAARKALILLTNTSQGSIPCRSSEQPQARWQCHPRLCQAQVAVPLAELCGWFWSFLFHPHLYNSSSISALHAWFLNCSLRLISVSYIHSCLGF